MYKGKLGQAGLDVQVHVFQVQLPFEAAGFNVLDDLGHAALDVRFVLPAAAALLGQPLGLG